MSDEENCHSLSSNPRRKYIKRFINNLNENFDEERRRTQMLIYVGNYTSK